MVNPENPDLSIDDIHELDLQDQVGNLTSLEQENILPTFQQGVVTSKGEVEKLARFFATLPGTDSVKSNFFGFITQIHQYGFYDKSDLQLLMLMYEQAESAFINSVPSWEWTRHHTLTLNNIKAIVYSIVRGAVGTEHDITNQRTALNEMSIKRTFNEGRQKAKRNLFNF